MNSIKNNFVIPSTMISLLVLVWSCATHKINLEHVPLMEEVKGEKTSLEIRRKSFNSYVPNEKEKYLHGTKFVRINMHFIDHPVYPQNFDSITGMAFARELIQVANSRLTQNVPMRLPLGNTTPAISAGIQFEIVKKSNQEPALYFHKDSIHGYFVNKGRDQNNYDRSVIKKYGRNLDSVLNVFIIPTHPDSVSSPTYGGYIGGIALYDAIKLTGDFLSQPETWRYAGVLNHELGHILGLTHSWHHDGCDDTPIHDNCWNFTQNGSPCDSLVSNNFMDSNADQNAMTPCQIGKMRQNLSELSRPGRKFVKPYFCQIDLSLPEIIIQDSVVWEGAYDLSQSIRIKSQGKLTIRNRVAMPEGSQIFIEKGGLLLLEPTAYLHNACKKPWLGIRTNTKSPSIQIIRGARIEDLTTYSPEVGNLSNDK